MRVTKTTKLVLGAALAVAASYTSQAALSQLSISHYAGSGYSFGLTVQGTSQTSYAVAFSASLQSGDPLPTGHSSPFTTFCLDIDTTLANGWWQSGSFSEVPLTSDTGKVRQGVASLQYAAQLYQTFAGTIPAGGWTSAQKAEGSALQLAIWEVLYEYGTAGAFNLSSGPGFTVTSGDSAIRARAQDMLDSLTFGAPDTSLSTTFWNAANADGSARSSQDLIGPMTPIPEPTTCIAGALLLLPFLGSTLRVWQKRQS
ncbi:MAG: hypothetical protein KIS67_17390 [Verrucomicrobiae bacterium]|nr:hypothetical protein [Verrucomicrobiae bacterium]